MRVLMTADTVGGVFTYALDLIGGLRALGDEVVLATFGAPLTADQRAALAEAGPAAVHESALRLEWMDDPWDDVAAAEEWLLELEQREGADVVHLNAFAHGAAAFRAPVLVAGHSCVLSWWEAVHGTDAPPAWDRYREVVGRGLRGADAVIAPTRAMLSALERLYGPLPARTAVVPNGSSSPEADAGVAKERLVLAAGRLWDEAKNLAALDRVAATLDAPVLVAGEGGATASAARALGRLSRGELAAVRRRAAVFAAPARYEPFGLAALEAARDRCALVLGDIPSLREVWGDAARYVAPADDDALRSALQDLLDDPAACSELGERAQRRGARYTVAAMAGAHRDLYAELARRPQEVPA